MPIVTAGGKSAAATITPTKTLDKPVVNDSAAAAPEAKASTTASMPTKVLLINSVLGEADPGQKKPAKNAMATANKIPTTRDFTASLTKSISPKAAPKLKAKLGPNKGAITIAPTTTVTLFSIRPIAATTVDNTTNNK